MTVVIYASQGVVHAEARLAPYDVTPLLYHPYEIKRERSDVTTTEADVDELAGGDTVGTLVRLEQEHWPCTRSFF